MSPSLWAAPARATAAVVRKSTRSLPQATRRLNMRNLTRAMILTVGLAPTLGAGNPSGATVVSGTVNLSGLGTSTLTVNQGSAHAIVNWNDFSIGQGELVRFNQPSASAAILNRVT